MTATITGPRPSRLPLLEAIRGQGSEHNSFSFSSYHTDIYNSRSQWALSVPFEPGCSPSPPPHPPFPIPLSPPYPPPLPPPPLSPVTPSFVWALTHLRRRRLSVFGSSSNFHPGYKDGIVGSLRSLSPVRTLQRKAVHMCLIWSSRERESVKSSPSHCCRQSGDEEGVGSASGGDILLLFLDMIFRETSE